MSRRRRRAADFTDSLQSFHHVISEDSLEDTSSNGTNDIASWMERDKCASQNSGCSDLHSVILAGNTASAFTNYESLAPITLLSSSKDQSVPDLNKCIDLFHNESKDKLHNLNRNNVPFGEFDKCETKQNTENIGLSNSMVGSLTEELSNSALHHSQEHLTVTAKRHINSVSAQRDTNYNFASGSATINKLCTNKEDHDQNQKLFESVLCSLDNQVNRMKEATLSEHTLRRLSKNFMESPMNFMDKLIKVTEESVLNDSNDVRDSSSLNLSRLTAEFRKMCKYIKDESCPEWCASLTMSPTIGKIENNMNSVDFRSPEKKINKLLQSPSMKYSPVSPRLYALRRDKDIKKCKTLKDTPKCKSENNLQSFCLSEYGNDSFEYLEAACEKLYSESAEGHTPIRTTLSMPSLISMSVLRDICEEQMASLNTSNIAERAFGTGTNSQASMSSYKPVCRKSMDTVKSTTHCTNTNLESEGQSQSGLNKNVLLELVKRRKECFNALNTINESDQNSKEAESGIAASEPTNSVNDNDNAFINTLKSCQEYHHYLTRKKPLLNFLQEQNKYIIESISKERRSTQNACNEINKENLGERKTLPVKKTPKAYFKMNLKSPSPPCKSPMKESRKNSNNIYQNTKSRLFLTPGKSPVNQNVKKKRVYFPSMHAGPKISTNQNIMKSPHAKGLYRPNYDTVISPVHMYITGTDTQLIKNIRAKTDEMLLTPVKMRSITPIKKSQCLESRSNSKSQEKLSLKIQLSPKLYSTPKSHKSKSPQCIEITSNTNNVSDNCFSLPKVCYTSPYQVHMIKDSTPQKMGSRMKSLLSPAQSKVVIQHRGKANSGHVGKGTKGDNPISEIYYNPEDVSVHIEQTATRTNFMRNQ